MKKRIMLLGTVVLLVWGISGCTGKGSRETVKEADTETVESGESETQSKKHNVKREWKIAKHQSDRQPVLGVDNENYEGFRYLAPYRLESDHYKAVIYLPEDEYAVAEQGNALTERAGVWVTAQLEPIFWSDMENDSLEESLQTYTELDKQIYEEMEDYWEVEISEVRVLDDHRMEAEFSYITYNPYSEVYVPYWGIYYLVRTDDGRLFFMTIEVNGEGADGTTEAVLEEFGEYLQIELEYDREAMMAKAAKYDEAENPEGENGNMASTDFWTFELPEGWEKDTVSSTDDQYIFAPGGSIAAEKVIYISGKYIGEDVSYVRDMDEDRLVGLFEILLEDDINIDHISVVGDTAVGYAVKIEYKEQRLNAVTYIIFENQSAYIVAAVEAGKGTEAFEAAEHIINTAKVK